MYGVFDKFLIKIHQKIISRSISVHFGLEHQAGTDLCSRAHAHKGDILHRCLGKELRKTLESNGEFQQKTKVHDVLWKVGEQLEITDDKLFGLALRQPTEGIG